MFFSINLYSEENVMQERPIFISVLVPVYNVPEKLLRQCLNSLLRQTLIQTEFILIDDGSTNNSGEICDEYASKDSRIIVKHEKNSGLSSTRNKAFSYARGTYIMFLDGDDYIAAQACEQAYKAAHKNNVDVVFWNIQTEFSHSSSLTKVFQNGSRLLSSTEIEDLQSNVLNFNAKIGQVFAKIVRRELLTNANILHQEKLKQGAEGIVFNFELFANVKSAYYLDEPLNHYVYNSKSISHSPDVNNYYLIVRCFSFIENLINKKKYKNSEKMLKLLKTRLLYVIITTAITGVFNPMNKISYRKKVQQYQKFLQEEIIDNSLKCGDRESLSWTRKVILWLIEHKYFLIIQLLAWLRRLQYKNR